MKRTSVLIAPYAAWMVLMTLLPRSAWSYALQGLVTTALLVYVFASLRKAGFRMPRVGGSGFLVGSLVGLLVLAVWIAPEPWLWPTAVQEASPYAPQTCGWPLTLVKLAASAFVISAAEELFFRKWLVDFAGFGWMLVLFGVEHMRWDLGVVRGSVFIAEGVFAGLCYGLLAKRFGIVSAIVAHAVTNLLLGVYVIACDKWFYW